MVIVQILSIEINIRINCLNETKIWSANTRTHKLKVYKKKNSINASELKTGCIGKGKPVRENMQKYKLYKSMQGWPTSMQLFDPFIVSGNYGYVFCHLYEILGRDKYVEFHNQANELS